MSFKNNASDDQLAIIALAKKPQIDIKAYNAANELLNWWERGANGIRCKVYRDDVLRKVYCSHLINLGTYLEPFIRQKRIERGNRHIFTQFLWLRDRWLKHRQSQTCHLSVIKKVIIVFIVLTCLIILILQTELYHHYLQ